MPNLILKPTLADRARASISHRLLRIRSASGKSGGNGWLAGDDEENIALRILSIWVQTLEIDDHHRNP